MSFDPEGKRPTKLTRSRADCTELLRAVDEERLTMDQVVVTVDKHGNTSAASIPLALDQAVRSGKIKRGDKLLLEAFGGGFTWASSLIKY